MPWFVYLGLNLIWTVGAVLIEARWAIVVLGIAILTTIVYLIDRRRAADKKIGNLSPLTLGTWFTAGLGLSVAGGGIIAVIAWPKPPRFSSLPTTSVKQANDRAANNADAGSLTPNGIGPWPDRASEETAPSLSKTVGSTSKPVTTTIDARCKYTATPECPLYTSSSTDGPHLSICVHSIDSSDGTVKISLADSRTATSKLTLAYALLFFVGSQRRCGAVADGFERIASTSFDFDTAIDVKKIFEKESRESLSYCVTATTIDDESDSSHDYSDYVTVHRTCSP